METREKVTFFEALDTIQCINKPAKENAGEDSFFCNSGKRSAIISVCDGCGGLGARKYPKFQNHTGAYVASRVVSGALNDWFYMHKSEKWSDLDRFAASVEKYIRKAYEVCSAYAVDRINIQGAMIRKLPTTLAMAYAENTSTGVLVNILWAGDSRVYLLDSKGMAQLTKDDTGVEDALDNLREDGAMSNVLSSDGEFFLNKKQIIVTEPTILLTATDGCFGYFHSPMEFEYSFLEALLCSESPKEFREKLYTKIKEYAGDDFSMGIMSFFCGDFRAYSELFGNRYHMLEENYMKALTESEDEMIVDKLWSKYKKTYERYIR